MPARPAGRSTHWRAHRGGHRRRLEAGHHRPPRSRWLPVFPDAAAGTPLPMSLPQGKADNQILGVVQALRRQTQVRTRTEVVLVSKDINMRVKARALGCTPTTTRTTRPWKTAICCIRGHWPCPPISGPPRQNHGKLAERQLYLLPHHRPRRTQPADQPVCVL
jgi:hypothetical protein